MAMPIVRIILLAAVALGAAVAIQPPAHAEDASPFKGLLVRGRMLAVIPQSSADISGIGGDTEISNAYVPELDLSWFFTKNIAVEAIAAITPHDAKATGTSLGTVDLGSVWLLPPTVLLQYHHPFQNGFKPYVGAGINYTIFLNEDAPGGTVTSIDYQNALGWALQVGADYMLNEHWLVNVDVKKLFLNTDVSINNGAIKANVDIDPWIIGAGLGYRF
jgi:outer membrane protein